MREMTGDPQGVQNVSLIRVYFSKKIAEGTLSQCWSYFTLLSFILDISFD